MGTDQYHPEAAAIMRQAQEEEFNHFSMDLEFLLRRTPLWREIAECVLFQPGAIVERAEIRELHVPRRHPRGRRRAPVSLTTTAP